MTGATAAASSEIGWPGLAAAVVFGTMLREIGRGLGNGTLGWTGLTNAAAATGENPTASAMLAAAAVHRNAFARANGCMAPFRCESGKRAHPRSISLKLWTKC